MTNIRKLRKARGISQCELAARVGVTQRFISYVENGYRPPRSQAPARIAALLEVTIEELYTH